MKRRLFSVLALLAAATGCLWADINFTDSIVNPSFEDGFKGWKTQGLKLQTNTEFAGKQGDTYAEKWVSKGKAVGNGYALQQMGENLPMGIYTLKASAQNIQQDNAENQTGAWLVAGCDSVAVSARADYEVRYVHLGGPFSIGFSAPNASGNWMAVDNFRLTYVSASFSELENELAQRLDKAETLLHHPMNISDRERLLQCVDTAKEWQKNPQEESLQTVAVALSNAEKTALPSFRAFGRLAEEIAKAKTMYDESLPGAFELEKSIGEAENALADESLNIAQVEEAICKMQGAVLLFRAANATGPTPTVVTDARVARGATMAFGRASFSGSGIVEKGFCWSTSRRPSVADHHSTLCYSNNGDIFVMDGLKPATIYYIRPYAITKDFAVGYGEEMKICTLPMGTVTWTYNNGGSEAENERINNAVADAVGVWNNLTSIRGMNISVNYGASTPTADCSYGGWMRVGPNASYQRTGTILHEMAHAAGVGTIDRWYNSGVYREDVSRGIWLGERTDQVLCFLENTNDAHLKGDNTHFWPYGVNGAHEDDGSRMLYYANALIVQALGEDNLPPVKGAFASPAYTFTQNDEEEYYLFPAGVDFAQLAPVLTIGGNGVELVRKDWKQMLSDEVCAWRITFNPATQLYEFRNVSAGKALSANGGNVSVNGAENFGIQLLGSRQEVVNSYFHMKSYWLTFANGTNQPMALTVENNVGASRFDHQNTATSQRWLIVSKRDLSELAGIPYTQVDNADALSSAMTISGGRGQVFVSAAGQGGWITICNMHGQTTDRFYLQASAQIVHPLPAGIWLVNGRKVIILPR